MAITIRQATEADLPAISTLMLDAFVEYLPLYTSEAFAATTPDSDQLARRLAEGPVWLALLDNASIGTVSALPLGDELYIRGMAVVPHVRGMGIGKRLLRTVEDYALAQGYKRLTLSTTPFLDRAIQLYERFGFQRIADGPHDLFGTPLFTMSKQLVD